MGSSWQHSGRCRHRGIVLFVVMSNRKGTGAAHGRTGAPGTYGAMPQRLVPRSVGRNSGSGAVPAAGSVPATTRTVPQAEEVPPQPGQYPDQGQQRTVPSGLSSSQA